MNVTAEERIMYSVMKAVYDSGIPISFKGSMVLKACLFEAGFLDETRHTVDIDANWNTDTPPTAEQMVESLQRAINRGGMDYEVRLYRMYGEKRSAGFELVDRNTDEILFTMLMCGKVTNDNLIDSSHYFRNTDQYEKLMWGFSYISFCLSKHFGESDVFVSFLLTASL